MSERTDLTIDHQTWNRGGKYAAIDPDTGAEMGKVVYMESLTGPNVLCILTAEVAPEFRRTGVMAGLWRRMANDHVGWHFHANNRNPDAEAFYQFLKNEHADLYALYHDPNAVEGILHPEPPRWQQ